MLRWRVYFNQRLEKLLICSNFLWRLRRWHEISRFAQFLQKEIFLETLIVVFENVLPKGFFWPSMKNFEISVLTANSRYLQTAALKYGIWFKRLKSVKFNLKKEDWKNRFWGFKIGSGFRDAGDILPPKESVVGYWWNLTLITKVRRFLIIALYITFLNKKILGFRFSTKNSLPWK